MSDLSLIPLQDGFETQLSQDWDGNTGTVYVLATPSYTPTTENTYIVVNPGKTNMQIAEITDYDSTAKTLTVSSISFEKGLGISSTAQDHSTGSKVIISDNYQFWEDIQTAINTKLDDTGGTMTGLLQFTGTTHAGIKLISLTTAQRDALSASNGMLIYNSTTGELNQYIGGAWSAVASGSTQPNASATVAGKVEIATTAESIAGTDTGGTGALLSVLPSDIAKNTQSSIFVGGADAGGDDTYVVALTPTLTAYTTRQRLRATLTTANTGACTIDFGPGVKNIKLIDGTDPLDGDIAAGGTYDFIYDGTNMVLQQVPVRALAADITAGTSTIKYPTVAQMTTQINSSTVVPEQDIPYATTNTTTNVTRFIWTTSTDGTVGFLCYNSSSSTAQIRRYTKDTTTGQYMATHTTSFTGSSGADGTCLAVAGNYVYLIYSDGGTKSMRRYDIADLANVTTITVSGTTWTTGSSAFGDGTNIYVYTATNQFMKYTVSGTTVTYDSTITYTSADTANNGGATCDGTNVYINGAAGATVTLRKYALAGGAVVSTTVREIPTAAYSGVSVSTTQPFIYKSTVLGFAFGHVLCTDLAISGAAMKLVAISKP